MLYTSTSYCVKCTKINNLITMSRIIVSVNICHCISTSSITDMIYSVLKSCGSFILRYSGGSDSQTHTNYKVMSDSQMSFHYVMGISINISKILCFLSRGCLIKTVGGISLGYFTNDQLSGVISMSLHLLLAQPFPGRCMDSQNNPCGRPEVEQMSWQYAMLEIRPLLIAHCWLILEMSIVSLMRQLHAFIIIFVSLQQRVCERKREKESPKII